MGLKIQLKKSNEEEERIKKAKLLHAPDLVTFECPKPVKVKEIHNTHMEIKDSIKTMQNDTLRHLNNVK